MGMPKIELALSARDVARYAEAADRSGQSLNAWLLEAAEHRLAGERSKGITSAEGLRTFFEHCDADRAVELEPNWDEQRRLIERSRLDGLSDS